LEGFYKRAIELHERSLTILRANSAANCSLFVNGLNNLAVAHRLQGSYSIARKLLDQAISITEEVESQEGELMGLCITNLASLTYHEGDHETAELLIKRAISIYEKALGDAHPHTQLARESFLQMVIEQISQSESRLNSRLEQGSKLPPSIQKEPKSRYDPAMKGHNRNAPCPCGSGKKYKKCCGRH
jgi:tetratricopeptide (TPR) repeat protein